ncbi:MAG: hypothetical protein FWC27_05530, partial [Firmicutes bacterium]|nr:hypothetical protein [Bacillota bacterium]
MELHPNFIQAIDNGEIEKVRARIINSVSRDPSLKTAKEMLAYAKERLGEALFQAHDGAPMKTEDTSAWAGNYADFLAGQLSGNFSEKRLYHLFDVTRFLYAGRGDAKAGGVSAGQMLAGGLAAAGIVTGVTGIVIHCAPAIAAGAAGA